MFDRKFVRDNLQAITNGVISRGLRFDANKFQQLDAVISDIQKELDMVRRNKKVNARMYSASAKTLQASDRQEGRLAKEKEKELAGRLEKKKKELSLLLDDLPNIPLPDVPVGMSEKDNVQMGASRGVKPVFSFAPKDYLTIAETLGVIDVHRAAKVSGARFGYITGKLAQLEFALIQYALQILLPQEFRLILPPVLISKENMRAMGYLAGEGERETYHFPEDDLYLVGTSEQSVGPMHRDETFSENQLPLRYVAFSTCFRREAGSYGKDTKGILRVHQFDKVEMFSYTTPETSEQEHQFLLKKQEELMQGLELHYRVMRLCTGDMSYASAKTYDIETWMPGQGIFRETHSTSTTTTYQSLPLNIKVQRAKGKKDYVYMLNGTAFAIGRTLVAIIENYQQADGTIVVPKVLRPFTRFAVIGKA